MMSVSDSDEAAPVFVGPLFELWCHVKFSRHFGRWRIVGCHCLERFREGLVMKVVLPLTRITQF